MLSVLCSSACPGKNSEHVQNRSAILGSLSDNKYSAASGPSKQGHAVPDTERALSADARVGLLASRGAAGLVQLAKVWDENLTPGGGGPGFS